MPQLTDEPNGANMPSSIHRCIIYACMLLVVAAYGWTPTAPAAEPSGSDLYSYRKGQNCARRALSDPITVIFYGSAATTRTLAGYERGGPFQRDVEGNVTKHTDWVRHNTDNLFRQEFRSTDRGCVLNPADTDLASTSGFGHDRWHLRMWDFKLNVIEPDTFYVGTTPHREDWYYGDGAGPGEPGDRHDCGTGPGTGSHAVERGAVDRSAQEYERHGSGFDRARRYLYRAYGKGQSSRHKIQTRNVGNTRSVKQCDREYAGSNGTAYMIGIGKRQ